MIRIERKIKRVGTIKEFCEQQREPKAPVDIANEVKHKVLTHFEDNQAIYVSAGLTVLLFVGLPDVGFASTGIDAKAKDIYDKLLTVAKWIIITKGGLEVIKGVTNGDIDSVKKSFLGHLFVFLLLLAYPWAMDEVEKLFNS